jgi:predicted metalloprotease with PDZ domain
MKTVYHVELADPAAHEFEVRLSLESAPEGLTLRLPAWIPGSYMIRDFARNLLDIRAAAGGASLELAKIDKQTWRLAPTSASVVVTYRVYANDLSVRTAFLDMTRGYFNGPSMFLEPVGQQGGFEVHIVRPSVGLGEHWRVATTLEPLAVDDAGFGAYRADSYATLIDHPVEIGPFARWPFVVAGLPHEMIISGRQQCDGERLSRDLAAICSEHVRMFGELPDMPRYLFLTLALGEGYGGLEHKESSSLICERADLPSRGMEKPTEGYRRFLGLCSHEYFHLWNVKRIRPAVFLEPDLSREVHTTLLWAFEGITSYYDDLALVRSGCIDQAAYLEMLAHTVTRVTRGAGRMRQSIAESSFDAWTKFYKQDENAPNAVVSYYAKGALVALGLDMALRDATGEQVSLDDLMRALWRRYGKPEVGVPEDGIERLASELAGQDLSGFFSDFVHDTTELPLQRWFEGLGIGFRLRAAAKPDDIGGYVDEAKPLPASAVLGARFQSAGDLTQITHVYLGGAAHLAGLSAGDRLVAVNGLQAKPDRLAAMIAALPPACPVLVHLLRRDELMTVSLRPLAAPADTCDLWLPDASSLSAAQRQRREAWFSGRANGH